jgi:hypothetical protein
MTAHAPSVTAAATIARRGFLRLALSQPFTAFEPQGSTVLQIVKEFSKPVSDRKLIVCTLKLPRRAASPIVLADRLR